MASGDSDRDTKYAISKLLQMGTVAEYQNEFEMLIKRVTRMAESLLKTFCISGLKPALQCALLRSNPTTLDEAFSLARAAEAHFTDLQLWELLRSNPTTLREAFFRVCITEAHFEEITGKELKIKEKADTYLSWLSEEAPLVVKGPFDANEDTILSLRSEDPNLRIQEKAVEYVRALNAAPREVVLKDRGGEFDDRLYEINLDLSQEFVIRISESRDVSGESLVG
nr:class II heat shock protein [Tanacetum cinerariifolium]